MEKYTPDEAEVFYYAFEYSILGKDIVNLRKVAEFILRNKAKFNYGCKSEMVCISKYTIDKSKDDGLSDTKDFVKLLKRFVKELITEDKEPL